MGSTISEARLNDLNSKLKTSSYIVGHAPSQADVITYKALSGAPDADKHPHAARWYKHIDSYQNEFSSLPGDASVDVSSYLPEATTSAAPDAEEEDDEVDLFGSSDEEVDEEKEALTKKRLEEYAAKKAGKTKPAAKSVVTMEIKPWDDTTDMAQLEKNVRAIEKDGLVWGASTLVAVGYGIKKLQINLVVEDDKIGLDDLQQEIEGDEDHVQSTDIAAMQKL
ncbi:hypothetical protein B9Z19DRAFT_1094573 [Tuber borchii]|uniref:Elongation factor 1-beta n=1 Tax=Tuber borchii TaxID=42251 RepID=A0A2T6ZDV9_TUBBO|nr:hypothetical protein B9Z19DRAFT_1094573 [Tuber borchii]